jgi:hypothetical protein
MDYVVTYQSNLLNLSCIYTIMVCVNIFMMMTLDRSGTPLMSIRFDYRLDVVITSHLVIRAKFGD